MPRTLTTLLASLLLAALPAVAELSPTEARIADHAARLGGEPAVALLAETVDINSGTMNVTGVRAVANVMRREFDTLGFTSTWHDMAAVDRAGHLFTERAGPGHCVLLIGHLDTVFEPDSPFQRFERDGSHATGPGVNDMKGGNVVIVQALKALAAADALDDLHVIVALIGDEEKAGRPTSTSRRHLVEAAQRCPLALGFETSSNLDEATVARRGSSGWTLEVSGRQAHSSGVFSPDVGSGAIFELARILDAFHAELRGEPFLTFNPGVVLGGTDVQYDAATNRGSAFGKTNVVARRALAHGGVRTISTDQLEHVRERMRAIVAARNHPHTSATITFSDGYPAMPPTPGNLAVLEVLSRVSEDLGRGPVTAYDPGKRGAADISFVAQYVSGIDGIGVEGRGAHSPEESIDLGTLPYLTQRAALLLYRLGTAGIEAAD